MNWIIDCDPGLDDLLALGYAFRKKLNIIGICSVAGNVTIEHTTDNILKLVSIYGNKIPVYQGVSGPIFGDMSNASFVHGEDGVKGVLSDTTINQAKEDKMAFQFINDAALQLNGKLSICALGPLSNIALALLNYPSLKKKISKIVLMGGGHQFGNHTPSAEFNILADPYAAKVVFESGIPIEMVGLDATMSTGLTPDEVKHVLNDKKLDDFAQLMKAVIDEYTLVYKELGYTHLFLHDLIAMMSIVRDDFLEYQNVYVTVETKGKLTKGKTILDIHNLLNKEVNTRVAIQLNKDILLEEIEALFESRKEDLV